MPKYTFRMNRRKAENLHAKLKAHYRSYAGLPRLVVMAAYDYLCLLRELDPDRQDYVPIDPERPGGLFRRFLSRDT